MFKLNVKFSKFGDMVYISHLDVLRLLQRALRRANLPFYLSQGFNPHPKISMGQALGLGKESQDLEAQFNLNQRIQEKEFILRINQKLMKGVLLNDAIYQS